ncbi:uncharacterized protein LOC121393664 isoform X2 [Xenopus laevis]|uniref:Uncharacterized protein LOC121393664 isoform X1 n=1 Tax=Xenopus laevis TaxID=8355 RepID=A0A8J1KMZ5_XENLA|nr:uncharacterized protein LOC121393664 isoform X1 [Xenopus laevis]XP_041418681.1 uncharacterized protein LOC121393664 isoform X2 [Xenopus laevis]
MFPRGGKTRSSASITYLACASCGAKFPKGQGDPTCAACTASGETSNPSIALEVSELASDAPAGVSSGASASHPYSMGDNPPTWALQLSQSLASLQGIANLSSSQDKFVAHLSVQPQAKHRKAPSKRRVPLSVSSEDSADDIGDSEFSEGEISSASSEGIPDPDKEVPHDIQGIIRAIKTSLQLEDPSGAGSGAKGPFKRQRKQSAEFPFHDQLGEVIQQEWDCPEKKFQPSRRFSRSYPFARELTEKWGVPPAVDAPVSRLSKNTALPVPDAAAFKDPTDKRLEGFLRSIFISAGSTFRPIIAAAWVSRAMADWAQELLDGLKNNLPRAELSSLADQMVDANAFLGDALLDSLQASARTSATAVAARRALWLKHWTADLSSKKALTSMAFKGRRLFGDDLEKIISQATGGKSTLLPQHKSRIHTGQRRGRFFRGQTSRSSREVRPTSSFRSKNRFQHKSKVRPGSLGRTNRSPPLTSPLHNDGTGPPVPDQAVGGSLALVPGGMARLGVRCVGSRACSGGVQDRVSISSPRTILPFQDSSEKPKERGFFLQWFRDFFRPELSCQSQRTRSSRVSTQIYLWCPRRMAPFDQFWI